MRKPPHRRATRRFTCRCSPTCTAAWCTRNTLELRFHLAVKARVRLLAKRHKKVVASTPTRTLAAGNRKLLLRLNPRSWPTKLDLQTHALAPLPTVTATGGGAGSKTVTTSLTVLPHVPLFSGSGTLP